jgi:hypothetical protein
MRARVPISSVINKDRRTIVTVTVREEFELNFVVFFCHHLNTQNNSSSCSILTHTVTLTLTRFKKRLPFASLRCKQSKSYFFTTIFEQLFDIMVNNHSKFFLTVDC